MLVVFDHFVSMVMHVFTLSVDVGMAMDMCVFMCMAQITMAMLMGVHMAMFMHML